MTLILNPDNHVDYRLAAKLPLEEEQLCKAKEIIRAANLPIVLDIGANIGLYTVSLGLLPEVAQVHAFEPVRANFNQLCGNIFLNNLDGKVDAHRIAVGSSRSTAVILHCAGCLVSASALARPASKGASARSLLSMRSQIALPRRQRGMRFWKPLGSKTFSTGRGGRSSSRWTSKVMSWLH